MNPYGQPYTAGHAYPAVPGPMSPNDERMWGMLSYLLAIFAGLLAPLIIYLVYKDRSAFVRETARESLNFHITAMIVSLAGVAVMVVGFGVSVLVPVIGIFMFVALWLLLIAFGVLVLVVNILGAIKANSGITYRIPGILRFVH